MGSSWLFSWVDHGGDRYEARLCAQAWSVVHTLHLVTMGRKDEAYEETWRTRLQRYHNNKGGGLNLAASIFIV